MKNLYALIALLAIASCDNKSTTLNTMTTKQQMDATTKTIENMQTAYKGERTATAKYEAFSKKAEEEGYHHIALLYNAVSAAENIHSINHRAVIEDAGGIVPVITPEYVVKNTRQNLYDDVNGEAYEANTMYPEFLKTAQAANNQVAALSLSYAMKTELKHNLFFQQALDHINNKTSDHIPAKYFVCPACGNTYEATAPKHCDFSLTAGDKFIVFQ